MFQYVFICNNKNSRMKASSIRYQNEIDQHLKNQYHQICFDPKKREILLRLTEDNRKLAEEGFAIEKLKNGGLSNSMLREYIQGVYDQYGIEDPIKRQLRLAKRNQSLEIPSSPEKSLNLTRISESDRLTRTKKKLINMKASFKRDSEDIVYSSHLTNQNASLRDNNTPTNRSRISRQIGYKTKEKIYFKTLPREEGIRQVDRPLINHQFSIQRSDHSKVMIRFNNPERTYSPPKREIPTVFRYCPMCEEPILQYNIQHHEMQCKDIQMAYQMSYEEISAIILGKIERLSGEIQLEFLQKDEGLILNEYRNLKQSIKLYIDQQAIHSFEKIKDQFQSFTGNVFEKATKLNWFKNLHRRIAAESSHLIAFK